MPKKGRSERWGKWGEKCGGLKRGFPANQISAYSWPTPIWQSYLELGGWIDLERLRISAMEKNWPTTGQYPGRKYFRNASWQNAEQRIGYQAKESEFIACFDNLHGEKLSVRFGWDGDAALSMPNAPRTWKAKLKFLQVRMSGNLKLAIYKADIIM